ncbi:hypothetical protein [Arthrobacter castelli]|uniref:hypothetical protein n=1 Tax=Arthrobacter castelli TaxID=271431 RepID=UPI000408B88B|nr:hypothetical protein [Arthrobacter castelli]
MPRYPISSAYLRLKSTWRRRFGTTALHRAETGSAVVEFTFLGTLLLIPVVYLVLAVGSLQAGSFASVGAADQAAKVFAAAETAQEGHQRAAQAAMLAVTDHGFSGSDVTLEIVCTEGQCLEPGSIVTAHVAVAVPMPLIPAMPGLDLSAATVEASATEIVERFG